MGKFDGLLLLTDLDDTLLTTDKRVSEENARAIEYFKSEGGLFTFATGRVPRGAKLMLKYVEPNAPMVCFNGAVVYDFAEEKILWSLTLGERAVNVVEYIDKMFDFVGIEICTADKIYFSKVNKIVERHKELEHLPDNYLAYREVKEKWVKVLFMTDEDKIPLVRRALALSPFANEYAFVQSSPWYYELLPKGANKGAGLLRLADLIGIDRLKTIGVGDNENDLELIKNAGVGVAVGNAIPAVKAAADHVTVNHSDHAIAAVINDIESGKIVI